MTPGPDQPARPRATRLGGLLGAALLAILAMAARAV